ncbi:MAG: hypothetical protein AB1405_04080 [Bdellovibrionota bacterium]
MQLDYQVEEARVDGEVGYHFRVVGEGEGGAVVPLYSSADHIEELRISKAGYPNPHLARAVAQVVRKQLGTRN